MITIKIDEVEARKLCQQKISELLKEFMAIQLREE
jgi:hypothetical protein